MIVPPGDAPVTTPVVDGPSATVAIEDMLLLHVPPPGAPVHVVVAPAQIGVVPPDTDGVGVVAILAVELYEEKGIAAHTFCALTW